MYVVFVEELARPRAALDCAPLRRSELSQVHWTCSLGSAETLLTPIHTARTLDQAFAMIVCRCGYSYRFEAAQEQGWCLFLIDVERPERSPDPLHSSCIK